MRGTGYFHGGARLKTKSIINVILVLALFSSAVNAISIGAGPSTISFKNVVKGGYAETPIVVSTSGVDDIPCEIELTGDIKNWLSIDKGSSFTLPSKGRVTLNAVFQPPFDAEKGIYTGSIYIKAYPKNIIENGSGLTVGAGVKINVEAEISGEEIVSYVLKGSSVADTEIGYPIKITGIVENTGNVKVEPEINVEVFDFEGNLRKIFPGKSKSILPTVESNIDVQVPSADLGVGRYLAKLRVGKQQQTLTFSVLDEGTLALKGVMNSLTLNKIFVEIGESTKITSDVDNTGEVLIKKAKINYEVFIYDDKYQTEKLVKQFESKDVLDIPVKQSAEFTGYFTPSEPGRYVIYGYLTYGGKKTGAKSTVLNVYGNPRDYTWHILALVIVGIISLLWLTKREGDGKTRKFKKIWGDYLQIKT